MARLTLEHCLDSDCPGGPYAVDESVLRLRAAGTSLPAAIGQATASAGQAEPSVFAARIATALGVPDPPRSRAGLDAALREYEPELRATPEALEAARFLVASPPLPLSARGPYAALAAAAIAELPGRARRELHLPWLPVAEPVLAPLAGHAIVRGIRWMMRGRP